MTHDDAARRIDEIEREMRASGLWREAPLPAEAYEFREAFGADTMSFAPWLQFVFIPRVRSIVAGRGAFPPSSMVAARAVREFDGVDDAARLVSLLSEFDARINE